MTDLYDHETEEQEAPALPELAYLHQSSADLDTALAWLSEHWHGLPAPYLQSRIVNDHPGTSVRYRLVLSVMVDDFGGATLADCARRLAIGAPLGAVTKQHDDYGYVRVNRAFGTVAIEAWAGREQVCTRKVVGTETVEVPDPDAPRVKVERDVVEWECEPILAPTSEVAG